LLVGGCQSILRLGDQFLNHGGVLEQVEPASGTVDIGFCKVCPRNQIAVNLALISSQRGRFSIGVADR
jgi:hypothetical protein